MTMTEDRGGVAVLVLKLWDVVHPYVHPFAAHSVIKEKIEEALTAALPVGETPVAATHRHKKRGTEYVLIGYGRMQTSDWCTLEMGVQGPQDYITRTVDMREVAIYRSVDDGSLWVRPREEFEDGRFEALPAPSQSPKETRSERTP